MASPPVVPRSDDKGEFGEGGREPMPGIDVGGQFVVAVTQVLDEGVPRADASDGTVAWTRSKPGSLYRCVVALVNTLHLGPGSVGSAFRRR